MNKAIAAVVLFAVLTFGLASSAKGLDFNSLNLPVKLSFQLGFTVSMVPAANDVSGVLGLVVSPGKIYTDKQRTLVLTGTITNYSGEYRTPSMSFAVSSYTGPGMDLGRASIEPNLIPPGGSAKFTCHITLGNSRPQYAMYTLTDPSLPVVVSH